MDLRKDVLFYEDYSSFPISGSVNNLYVDKGTGIIYSWDGSEYVASGTPGSPTNQVVLFADLATTEALKACTYNNGTLGVGATLTGNANGQLSTVSFSDRIDNVVTALNQVILVKNQANQTQNGLYLVTQLGSVSQPFILTRATDADTQSEIYPLQINVFGGQTQANLAYLQKTIDPIIGTNPIVFTTTQLGIQNTPVLHVDTVTSSALPACTYTSGTNPTLPGQGAFLEANANGSIGTINGFALTNGRRVLIRDQANQAHNGVYVVSSAGSASTRWRLTRVDAWGANFTVLDREWKVNNPASTKYGARYSTNLLSLASTAIGTTNIIFSEAIVKDTDLSLSDNTTNDVSTTKHGFVPKAPNDATQFLDGTGAYDTVKDTDLSLSDNTTNNVSAARHGFVPKLPNNTTTFLRGDGTFAAPAAGGLTYFTEAQSTASPNATVNVDSLTAVASTTNADIALVPKGTGALLTAIPDNTTTGGNKRGANAIDLQTSRSAATQVASGSASIAIGKNNTASGTQSVSIGTSATASNTSIALNSNGSVTGSNAVGSGMGSIALNGGTASGSWSFSIGRSTASGVNSFAQGGYYSDNTASGDQSVAFGETNISSSYGSASFGLGNTSSSYATFCTGIGSASGSVYGRMCHSSGRVAVVGDSQKSIFTLAQRTTNNTATTLVSYYGAGTTPGTANQVILSNQSAYGFIGTIVGKQSGSTNAAMWKVEGLIVRGANAASTVLTTSTVTLVSNAPAWGTPTLAADTTNGGLQVQVVGAAATNIQWTAVIETTEVIYA